ncbi:MAG: sporulation protein Cse60 [Defluviitaleaceae bacterium]|nr:sporulation protein Cse60 [Defluviitaleaceae bacterium]
MKVKIITASTEKSLQKKIDMFLEQVRGIEIIDMQFSAGYGFMGIMIRYKRVM